MPNLVPVGTFSFRPEAERAKQLLDASEITSVVRGEDAAGWAPHLGFATGGVTLLVDPTDLERAKKLLEVPGQPDVP